MLTFKQFIRESSWDKLVYHATYNPDFDPKKPPVGTHFGTLHAAMARARSSIYDASYGSDHRIIMHSPEKLKVHAFKFNSKGGKEIRTKDDGRYDPGSWWGRPPPIPHGTTHEIYKNKIEDPGHDSIVVHDTKRLQYIHSFDKPKFVKRDYADRLVSRN
jgi:hypothetical protein